MSAAVAINGGFESKQSDRIAFYGPAGGLSVPSANRPLDLVHLARQTGGDRTLETELLQLFRQQLSLCGGQLRATTGRERKSIAHTIRGSAGAVGAFGLSQIALQIEETPSDPKLITVFEAEIARIRDFIAGLSR
jgi:HPt (histidine-containing phosphotransfer) domain-containing protein